MANPFFEQAAAPYTTFNFVVEIRVPGLSQGLCAGAFSECEGLEMTMEPKVLREGGNNGVVHRLSGPVGYAQLTLKRGVTANVDLWEWFSRSIDDPSLRGDGEVVLLGPDRAERARFLLTRCVPVKLKAPALNAKDGLVAVEELGLAYERLRLRAPGGVGLGVGGVSVSAGVSLGG